MKMTRIARSGFAISAQMDLFQQEMSTTATSATSAPATSAATSSAISSQALGFGRSRFAWPDGRTAAASGPEAVHAVLSPRAAKDLGLLTIATSGPRGIGSSASADLSASLGSRLKASMAGSGSTLYRLTWKTVATPAGRPYCLLRGSVRRTCDTGSFGWPTPTAMDAESSGTSATNAGQTLTDAARTAGWPTPRESDWTGASEAAQARGAGSDLRTVESTGFSAKRLAAGKIPDNLHSATKLLVAGEPWSARKGSEDAPASLERALQRGWATPNARDYRTPAHHTYEERGGGKKGENLNHQVAHFIPGASLNGLNAATASGGLLNPLMSGWLQGIPPAWLDCAPLPTRMKK